MSITITEMRDELEKIIKTHVYQNNSKYASHNAKMFMDWTTIWYNNLLWDTDPESADYYDVLMSHWLPSLSDWEVETTYESLYNSWFEMNGYYDHQRNYEVLKDKIIKYDQKHK